MCMKFFVFFLLFAPMFSVGDTDGEFSEDNEKKITLAGSMLHLLKGLDELKELAAGDYAPAQKFLALVNQDFKKAKEFFQEYNEKKLRPVLPPQGYSRTFLQLMIRDPTDNDISRIVKEMDAFFYGEDFLKALEHLDKGYLLLDMLKQQNYAPAYKFQKIFEESISQELQKQGAPAYQLSETLNQRCQTVFENYFR